MLRKPISEETANDLLSLIFYLTYLQTSQKGRETPTVSRANSGQNKI
jgi:hypothetical protein